MARKAKAVLNDIETNLAALPNMGPFSAKLLHAVGVTSVDDFMSRDPHELYDLTVEFSATPINRLMLKAIVAAQAGVHWQDVPLGKDGRAVLPASHPLAKAKRRGTTPPSRRPKSR